MKVSNGPYTGAVAAAAMASTASTRREMAAFAVLEVAGREHHGVASQLAQTFQHCTGRQTREKLDRRAVLETGHLIPQPGLPFAVPFRRARHDHQTPGLRMPAQRLVDGAGKLVFDRDADYVGGQRRNRSQQRPGNGHVDHRGLRKKLSAILQKEAQRLVARCDDHVGRSSTRTSRAGTWQRCGCDPLRRSGARRETRHT